MESILENKENNKENLESKTTESIESKSPENRETKNSENSDPKTIENRNSRDSDIDRISIEKNIHNQNMKKEDILLENKDKSILSYFFLIGHPFSSFKLTRDDLKYYEIQKPIILSSYSIEGQSKEFKKISSLLNKDLYLLQNIFPMKFELNSIDFDKSVDEVLQKVKPIPIYSKYISDKKPKPFFHSFEFKCWECHPYYTWFIHCFIYYDEVAIESKLIRKRYSAKAMVIVTHEAYMSLCKIILEKIYDYSLNPSYFPIEPYIMRLFNKLTKNSIEKKYISFDNNVRYLLYKDPFLNVLDINFAIFFKILTFDEAFFLAEYFIRGKNILVSADDARILYPFFYMLMTFMHPLNITDNSYFYKMSQLSTITYYYSMMSFISFNYTKHPIEDKILEKIAKRSGDNYIYIHIKYSNKRKEYYGKKKVVVNYIQNKNKVSTSIEEFPKDNLIKDVLLQTNSKDDFINLENEINNMEKEEDKNEIYLYKEFNEIREKLFWIMLRFFTYIIRYINLDEKFGKLYMKIKINEKIKNYQLKGLESTPIFDIIYKNDIDINNPNIYSSIILDSLIKISRQQSKISYLKQSIFEEDSNNNLLLDAFSTEELKKSGHKYLDILCNSQKIKNLGDQVFEISKVKDNKDNKDNQSIIIYSKLLLFFELFQNEKELKDTNDNPISLEIEDIIYLEIVNLKKLISAETLQIDRKEIYASGAIGIILIIIILYEENKNINKNLEYIKTLFGDLFYIFKETDAFFGKFDFLISIMFKIILSNEEIKNTYKNQFISILNPNHIPTIPMILLYQEENKKEYKTGPSKINNNNENDCKNDKEAVGNINSDKDKETFENTNNENDISKYKVYTPPYSEEKGKDGHYHDFIFEGNLKDENYFCKICHCQFQYTMKDNKKDLHNEVLCNSSIIVKKLIDKIILNYSIIFKEQDFDDEFYSFIFHINCFMKYYFKRDIKAFEYSEEK